MPQPEAAAALQTEQSRKDDGVSVCAVGNKKYLDLKLLSGCMTMGYRFPVLFPVPVCLLSPCEFTFCAHDLLCMFFTLLCGDICAGVLNAMYFCLLSMIVWTICDYYYQTNATSIIRPRHSTP